MVSLKIAVNVNSIIAVNLCNLLCVCSVAGAKYEFVFLTASHTSRRANWIRNAKTTDAKWDNQSVAEIDAVVATQGPFYAILGYSQGAAMAIAYLAHAPVGTFQIGLTFCAYIPTTYHDLVIPRIDATGASASTVPHR
jgi:hypothetical protein